VDVRVFLELIGEAVGAEKASTGHLRRLDGPTGADAAP
jgi:hypothetical protein